MKKLLLFLLLQFAIISNAQQVARSISLEDQKGVNGNTITRLTLAPDPPIAIAQTFCHGATVANLVATGTSLKWYDVEIAGGVLNETEVLTTKTYYVSQSVSGEESARTSVVVTVKDVPMPILFPTPSATVCIGDNITITANESSTVFLNTLQSGGTQVDCRCPSGYVAVGYKGRSDAWLDGMQLACKKLNTDGTLDPTIVYTSNIGGINGLVDGPHLLAANNVMVGGMSEKEYWGDYVSSFTGYGQPIAYILANGNNASSPVSLAKMGPTGSYLGSSFVPNGSVIVGMSGWENEYVTGISFIYRPINMIDKDLGEDTYSWSNGATTRSIVVSTPGTYTLTITDTNGCTGTSSQTVFTNPLSVGGAVTGGSTVNYEATSAELTLVGHVGNVVRWESSVNPYTSWTPIENTTTTYTSGVLTQNTQFRAVVQSGVCSTANSSPTTVNVITDVQWNGSVWIPNAPTDLNRVFITGNYNSALNGGNITAREMTVGFNADVVIESGHTVTLKGQLAVNGSFILNNNANLVQMDNITNYGNITIKRDTAPLKRLDYVLWSSPVKPDAYYNHYLQLFSPFTLDNRFYTYNGFANPNVYSTVVSPSTTLFENGIGYLIRLPNNHPESPTVWNGTFIGLPNNGDINLNGLSSDKYYAIGNPYPSTISADSFISNNGISEALYFWRKTNNSTNSSYATYTTAGGVANVGGDSLLLTPNGFIQVGQGFVVKAVSSNLSFTNTMRLPNFNNAPFLRTTRAEKNRIWLNLTNDTGVFSQALVAYMTNATSGVDAAIDGKFYNDTNTALTSLINKEEYAIQGRPLPFDTSDIVDLGFKAQLSGKYTISIANLDGIFSTTQDVLLQDNLIGQVHNLKKGSYSFDSDAGIFNSRFQLIYQKTLSLNQIIADENKVIVYKKNQEIVVNSGKIIIDSVSVFDARGRLIIQRKNVNSNETKLLSGSTKGTLIVKINTDSNSVITRKVIN